MRDLPVRSNGNCETARVRAEAVSCDVYTRHLVSGAVRRLSIKTIIFTGAKMYQKLINYWQFRQQSRATLYTFRRSSHDLQRGNIAQVRRKTRPPGLECRCGASRRSRATNTFAQRLKRCWLKVVYARIPTAIPPFSSARMVPGAQVTSDGWRTCGS